MDPGSRKDLTNGHRYSASTDPIKDDGNGLLKNGVFCCVTNNGVNGPRSRKTQISTARETTTAKNEGEAFVPTRIQLLTDWANLCTLFGTVLASIALACMWKRNFYLGMAFNVLANIADVIDGPIARSTANRHPAFSAIGSKMDCYSDLVSHFVVPASLLMNISDLHPVCVALAAAYICTGILRQSYFEVTGRCEDGACIYGVTSDYMVAVYSITMHLLPVVGMRWMPAVLSAAVVSMIFGSLTFSLRSRRYEGFGLLTATVFNVLLCFSCATLAIFANGNFSLVAGIMFAALLLLAYPLYFRFVELNR